MNIYHYTDLNGFKGIIESDSLWATNFHFMNDSQELKHGVDCVKGCLDYISSEFDVDFINGVRTAIEHYENSRANYVYNLSFCKKPDLLSQWRAYGKNQGVCLEFDSNELSECIDQSDLSYIDGDVIYTKPNATPEAKEKIIKFFQQNEPVNQSNNESILRQLNISNFVHIAIPYFKNDSFKEEDEYRVVIYPDEKFCGVKFRVNDKGLVPYIELKARKMDFYQIKLPIKKVIIGPCDNYDYLKRGVRLLLDNNGYKKTDINFSSIPFRN
ncbi:TPA: DUF2971 domain-containing protein [Serratia marcescens]|nr:DUF2971 domain-containing protein [Serratia marcescens]